MTASMLCHEAQKNSLAGQDSKVASNQLLQSTGHVLLQQEQCNLHHRQVHHRQACNASGKLYCDNGEPLTTG